MKTIMEMAREANLPACHATHPKALERFAALVREDERGRMCEQFKECLIEKSTRNETNK